MLNFDSWLSPFHCEKMGKLLTLPKTYFPILQSRNMLGTNDGVLWELNATICLKHLVDCDHCLNFHSMYSQNTYSVPTKLILLWNFPLFSSPKLLISLTWKGKKQLIWQLNSNFLPYFEKRLPLTERYGHSKQRDKIIAEHKSLTCATL